MKTDRVDLTRFLIHFTRARNEQTPFDILAKIVSDGYLACGWSFRSSRRTVFGTKKAVCFSETPLCGFLDYAYKRNNYTEISPYGLFISKKQFFDAGGRPVIYGTTMDPSNLEQELPDETKNLQGLDQTEQYRYILTTSIDDTNDWTHEREWRWANWRNQSDDENIFPLWKIGQKADKYTSANQNFRFGPIGLIVQTTAEKDNLIEILLSHYQSEQENFGEEDDFQSFSLDAIRVTVFIVLSEIDPEQIMTCNIESIINDEKHHKMRDILKQQGLI